MKRLLASTVLASFLMVPAVGFSASSATITTVSEFTSWLNAHPAAKADIKTAPSCSTVQKTCGATVTTGTYPCYVGAAANIMNILKPKYKVNIASVNPVIGVMPTYCYAGATTAKAASTGPLNAAQLHDKIDSSGSTGLVQAMSAAADFLNKACHGQYSSKTAPCYAKSVSVVGRVSTMLQNLKINTTQEAIFGALNYYD